MPCDSPPAGHQRHGGLPPRPRRRRPRRCSSPCPCPRKIGPSDMTALGILLLLAALYVLQVVLYDRLWGKGLEVKTSFQEEYATEDDTAAFDRGWWSTTSSCPSPVGGDRLPHGQGPALYRRGQHRRQRLHLPPGRVRLGPPAENHTRTLEFRCARRGYYRIDQAGLDVRSLLSADQKVRGLHPPRPRTSTCCPGWFPPSASKIPFSQIMGNLTSRKKVYDDPLCLLRGLRGYVRGDPMKYITWKATAKTGQLLVNPPRVHPVPEGGCGAGFRGPGRAAGRPAQRGGGAHRLHAVCAAAGRRASRSAPYSKRRLDVHSGQPMALPEGLRPRQRVGAAQGLRLRPGRQWPGAHRELFPQRGGAKGTRTACCACWSPGTSGRAWPGPLPSGPASGSGCKSSPTGTSTRKCPMFGTVRRLYWEV